MYTHQVNYSKRFITGVLKGKLYHDYLRFTSAKEAQEFKKICESGYEFSSCAGIILECTTQFAGYCAAAIIFNTTMAHTIMFGIDHHSNILCA